MNIHGDDRRLGIFDIFPTPGASVNVVRLRRGAICAWHRHQDQADHYFAVSGVVKVGMVSPSGDLFWHTLDAYYPETHTVPPTWWHGYSALTDDAVLLQYLDRKYDPNDEERRTIAEMGIEWAIQPR